MNVEYIDHLGTDLTIVNAARVSFDKESEWSPVITPDPNSDKWVKFVKDLSEKDKKLISYLAKHNHFTPFTHAVITLRETVPIFVARQRFKHTVGFTYNEVSRRYVSDEPTFFVPDVWRKRADNVKQGSSDEEVVHFPDIGFSSNYGEKIKDAYEEFVDYAQGLYSDLIHAGVAPEQARMVLPQSMYTSYYTTGSLYAFARAYLLRIDPHAQKEIRDLAEQWDKIIRPLYPEAWSALVD